MSYSFSYGKYKQTLHKCKVLRRLSRINLVFGQSDYYIPVLVDGSLEAGDILSVCFTDKEYSGSWYGPDNKTKEKTIEATLNFSPGYVYEINATPL